jgi:hypothetical protein
MKTNEEIDQIINNQIQGVFGGVEMNLFRQELSKLKSGDVYLEIGVDEGRSMTIAHLLAPEGVKVIGIDIYDVPPHSVSVGRGPWAVKVGMIGREKDNFFIHGDADNFADFLDFYMADNFINVLFIDGDHNYDGVKKNTLKWEPFVKQGGVILFHDYDHLETKRFLDEYYGDNKEVFGGKIVKVQK